MENEKKPIGWQERYKMVTQDMGQLNGAMDKVKKWVADGRGIAVWVNVDLTGGPNHSNCGHITFTPGDCGKPHWAYELVERLADTRRIDFYRQEIIMDKPISKMKAADQRKMKIEGWEYDKRRREWWRDVWVGEPNLPTCN